MTASYRMTEAQQAVLEGLTCERLTASLENQGLIQYFSAWRNPTLARVLKAKAWYEDEKGTTIYYVVKNKAGDILLYFSLKCGVLVDPGYEQKMDDLVTEAELIYKALQGAEQDDEDCIDFLNAERRRLGDQEYQSIVRGIYAEYEQRRYARKMIRNDKELQPRALRDKIIFVEETHPAVELVEFCSNDRAAQFWKQSGLGHKRIGETLFWQFIVPKMMELSDLVGCKYAYLFAADQESNGHLVHHYERFHFKKFDRLGPVKPAYDSGCYFMCRRLHTIERDMLTAYDVDRDDDDLLGLDHYRKEFFENFNKPEEKEKT